MKKQIHLGSLALVLLLAVLWLTGCQQTGEPGGPVHLLREDGAQVGELLVLVKGESLRLGLDLPPDDYKIESVSVDNRDAVFAAWMDGSLALRAEEIGEAQVGVRLSSKTKGAAELQFTVAVALPKMDFFAALAMGTPTRVTFENNLLSLRREDSVLLLLSAPSGTDFTLGEQTGNGVEVSRVQGGLRITARSVGEATLQVQATKEGYETASLELTVQVTATPLELRLSGEDLGPDGLLLEVGVPSVVEAASTPSGATVTVGSDNPAIVADVDGGTITLLADEEGSGTVTITAQSQGYYPVVKKLKVEAASTKAPLSLVSDQFDRPYHLILPQGEVVEVALFCGTGAEVTVTASDDGVQAQRVGGTLYIRGMHPGDTEVQIVAEEEGYRQNLRVLHVTVPGPQLELSADQAGPLHLYTGQKATVELICNQEEAALSTSLSKGIARVSIRDGVLLIDPLEEGEAVVTVTAQREGWEPAVLELAISITTPKIQLTADRLEVVAQLGETQELRFTSDPGEVEAVVELRDRIAAVYYQDGVLSIDPKEVGSTIITLTAHREGYQSASLSIPLTIQ